MRKNHFDNLKRKLYLKNEESRSIFKYITNNSTLPYSLRKEAFLQLINFPKNSSISKIRNRCILTGRSKGIYFKLSRHYFRKLASHGLIPGIKHANW